MADFSLVARFGMDATGIKTEIKQLRKEVDDFANKWAKIGIGVGFAAFAALSKGAMDLAGSLSDASANLGINVESLQALQAQHGRNGVSEAELQKAIEKTKAKVLEAAGGNKEAEKSFSALGLTSQGLLKLPLDQQYAAIAKAVANSKDQTAAYSAACDIFGEKVGPKLMGSLKELGKEGLPGVVASAKEAGHVMSKETIVALDRASDAIDDFRKKTTIAVGSILVNFSSKEGLLLLGMQLMKVLGEFGGGLLDAVWEAGQVTWAVFKGTFTGVKNYFQDGMVEAVKVVADALNKILPESFQIKVSNLDQFKSSGKDVSEEIKAAILKTEPSNFKKTIGETWDENIKKQKAVVDELNKKNYGEEADQIAKAGEAAGAAIADGGKKVAEGGKDGAEKIKGAGKEAGKAIADGGDEAAKKIVPVLDVMKRVMEGFTTAVTRTGNPYESQSTTSLEGVRARVKSQLDAAASDTSYSTAFTPGGKNPLFYALQNELYALDQELATRAKVSGYASRYGEEAARYQFGDTLTNRALQDITKENVRTASAVESINSRLGKLLGQPS